MATLYRWPAGEQSSSAGSAVTAASPTFGTPDPPPVIPGSFLQNGAHVSLRAQVEITSTSATPTCTLGFYAGAVAGAIGSAAVLCVTTALAVSASATAWQCFLQYDGTIRTISKSVGAINGSGLFFSLFNVGLTGTPVIGPMPQTAALRTVSTLNTQAAIQLDVGVTLSSTTGTPSVVVTNFWGEVTG